MMQDGIGSMMGWTMGLGWLAVLVVILLLVAGVIVLVRALSRPDSAGQSTAAGATAAKVVLVVLAVIGALALLSLAAMALMHAGMMG